MSALLIAFLLLAGLQTALSTRHVKGVITIGGVEAPDSVELYQPERGHSKTLSFTPKRYVFTCAGAYQTFDGRILALDDYTGRTYYYDVCDRTTSEGPRMSLNTLRGASTWLGGYVVHCGGAQLGTRKNGKNDVSHECEVLDSPQRNKTWTSGVDMPTRRWKHSMTRLNNLTILAVGGTDRRTLQTTDKLENGEWSRASSLSHKRSDHAAVLDRVFNLLVCGGEHRNRSGNDVTLNTCEMLKHEHSWTVGPQLNRARKGFTMVQYEGNVYAIGGWDGLNTFGSIEQLIDDKWMVARKPLRNRRRDHCSVAVDVKC